MKRIKEEIKINNLNLINLDEYEVIETPEEFDCNTNCDLILPDCLGGFVFYKKKNYTTRENTLSNMSSLKDTEYKRGQVTDNLVKEGVYLTSPQSQITAPHFTHDELIKEIKEIDTCIKGYKIQGDVQDLIDDALEELKSLKQKWEEEKKNIQGCGKELFYEFFRGKVKKYVCKCGEHNSFCDDCFKKIVKQNEEIDKIFKEYVI